MYDNGHTYFLYANLATKHSCLHKSCISAWTVTQPKDSFPFSFFSFFTFSSIIHQSEHDLVKQEMKLKRKLNASPISWGSVLSIKLF